MLKRALDIAVSLPVIALCLPFWLLVAMAIRLDSPGPILYPTFRTPGSKTWLFHLWGLSRHIALNFLIEQGSIACSEAHKLPYRPSILAC